MLPSKLVILLLICSLALPLSCDKHDEEEGAKKLTFPLRKESAHFAYYYDSLATADLQAIEKQLEDKYDSVISHFQPGPLPKIRIAIWAKQVDFDNAGNNRFPGAAGYVNGREEVRLLFVGPGTGAGAVHEFTHAVTLFLSPDFANNPRWLWEAAAIYEAKQFTDPRKLPYMLTGQYPTLDILSNEQGTTQRIYQVGYTIAEFIVQHWGYEGLRNLIRSHGDINKTLGISKESFEQQWYAFVKSTYL